MAPWLAVLAALQLAPPVMGPPGAGGPPPGGYAPAGFDAPHAALELSFTEAELAWAAPARARSRPRTEARSAGAPPACSGDVCQPRVSVPGFEPRFDARGKRTELVLLALDRAHVEPLATIVWALASTGLRFDYTPPQMDAGLASGHGGWGHVQLLLRWRIDAQNAPVWPERHR